MCFFITEGSLPPPPPPTFYSMKLWCLVPVFSGAWGLIMGCQVLEAIHAMSILELAANCGSFRISHALNLLLATQLFKAKKKKMESEPKTLQQENWDQAGA